MQTISLVQKPILESLTIIDIEGFIIDLHNDFLCDSFCMENKNVNISFVNEKGKRVFICLLGADIVKQDISFDFSGPIILDNFYKGRVLIDNILKDINNDGRHCFYIHFNESIYLEILAHDVLLGIEPPQSD